MWVWAGQCWLCGGTGAGADKMGGPVGETCLLVNVLAVGNSLALEADLVLVARQFWPTADGGGAQGCFFCQ